FDASTNVTYANTYCAMCHGKTRDLHLWSLKIRKQWRSKRQITLQDIRYPGTKWEGIPVDKQGALDRCLMTPVEAHTEPDTRIKELCRTYANGIRVNDRKWKDTKIFKNPHCALLARYKLSATTNEFKCSSKIGGRGLPLPFEKYVIFVFSFRAKTIQNVGHRIKTVRVNFNCSINEVYDPFKGQCLLPVSTHNDTNKTEQCQGPRFPSNEFHVLSNDSIFLHPHQKFYPNGSYILVNQSLILCSNFSRNYTKRIVTAAEKEKPLAHSLTLAHHHLYRLLAVNHRPPIPAGDVFPVF
ncbi:hypothetical protein OS493_039640, partial [Desmophyllum pertusum]